MTSEEVGAVRRFFGEHLVQRSLGLEADAGAFQVRGGLGAFPGGSASGFAGAAQTVEGGSAGAVPGVRGGGLCLSGVGSVSADDDGLGELD
jgi:hypothetical protein